MWTDAAKVTPEMHTNVNAKKNMVTTQRHKSQ